MGTPRQIKHFRKGLNWRAVISRGRLMWRHGPFYQHILIPPVTLPVLCASHILYRGRTGRVIFLGGWPGGSDFSLAPLFCVPCLGL